MRESCDGEEGELVTLRALEGGAVKNSATCAEARVWKLPRGSVVSASAYPPRA